MALGLIKVDQGYARVALAVAGLVCVVVLFVFAKWCFADAISPSAPDVQVADLAVRLDQDDPQTHFASAVLHEQTFEPADITLSLREYELAAELSPNNYLAWLELGRARDRSGDIAGAEQALEHALSLAPNYADVQWALGNLLVRSGRMEDGFSMMRSAANSKPEYMASAVSMAARYGSGDISGIRSLLGDGDGVNSGIAGYLAANGHWNDAVAAWDRVAAEARRTTYAEIGKDLTTKLVGAKQFRLAEQVAGDSVIDERRRPRPESLLNGGFETDILMHNGPLFDWQIGEGADPRIGVSVEQRHGGARSLALEYNTMLVSDFRQISQTVAVQPGTAYSFDGWYKTADIKGSVAWEVADASDGKTLSRTPPIQAAPDWSQFHIVFTVPAASDGIVVRLVRDGCTSAVCPISGRMWFDDLALTR